MAGMIRFLFPAIGFFCTALVLTGVGFFGYLRQSGTINDQKMFEIVALLHDIDLGNKSAAAAPQKADVPPEEMSYEERQKQLQIGEIQLQAKQEDLNSHLREFETRSRQLSTANSQYQNYKLEVEEYLNKIKADAETEGLDAVRNQLQNMDPKKQAKPLLSQMIREDKTLQVIQLLNGMSPSKRSEILKKFDTADDLTLLAIIQEKMLEGDPVKPFVERQLEELNKLNATESP